MPRQVPQYRSPCCRSHQQASEESSFPFGMGEGKSLDHVRQGVPSNGCCRDAQSLPRQTHTGRRRQTLVDAATIGCSAHACFVCGSYCCSITATYEVEQLLSVTKSRKIASLHKIRIQLLSLTLHEYKKYLFEKQTDEDYQSRSKRRFSTDGMLVPCTGR